MSNLSNVAIPQLETVSAEVEPGRVAMKGTIAMQSPGDALGPFFKSLHEAALADGLSELVVDVSGLTFVNSSAIRLFVDWASWLKKGAPDARYTLRFKTDASITWQKTSFGVLRSLAKDVIVIEAS